jgi:hippurate hydrolase
LEEIQEEEGEGSGALRKLGLVLMCCAVIRHSLGLYLCSYNRGSSIHAYGKDSVSDTITVSINDFLPDLGSFYTDVHAHPELSMQETRTAGLAAERLRANGFDVTTGVGQTGVIGLLRNGDGPVVMLRADMDALPVREETGLPYASTVTATDHNGKTVPVMHACGHDMHVTWLVGATTVFAHTREAWRGTLMAVFQPAEETAVGAQAMIADGLFTRFPTPDVVLGQHVMVGASGVLGWRTGVITSAGDSLQIRFFGRGAHGSMPQASIDPVVMAAATVLRLQTIVSREVAAAEAVVVTVSALQAGTKENVIPDEAIIKLNVRTFDEGVHTRACCHRADCPCRSSRFRGPQAARDHVARPLCPGEE